MWSSERTSNRPEQPYFSTGAYHESLYPHPAGKTLSVSERIPREVREELAKRGTRSGPLGHGRGECEGDCGESEIRSIDGRRGAGNGCLCDRLVKASGDRASGR